MVMALDRKTKIQALRQRLANLTPVEREAIANRGLVATVEGRTLSLHNTILVTIQANGYTPTVVGGYNQWKQAGRIVKRGEHGLMIWFPVGHKNEDDTIIEASTFYTGTVFDITQTEAIGKNEAVKPTPAQTPVLVPAIIEHKPETKVIPEDSLMKGWAAMPAPIEKQEEKEMKLKELTQRESVLAAAIDEAVRCEKAGHPWAAAYWNHAEEVARQTANAAEAYRANLTPSEQHEFDKLQAKKFLKSLVAAKLDTGK